jgi:hypothetical protein
MFSDDQAYLREEAAFAAGPGWASLAREAWDVVTGAGGRVTYVKEKFGELVVEFEGAQTVGDALEEIRDRSRRTCQGCSREGVLWREAWQRTLCVTCAVGAYIDGRALHELE